MAERLLVDRDLLTVVEQMWEAREKWYNIGLCFKIPPSQLDVIKSESRDDIDELFRKMITEWLRRGRCCNWKAVYDALKNPTVGKESTAEKLSEWFTKGRKRKATSQYGSQSKKFLLDQPGISRGPVCPENIFGYTATHNNSVYFTHGENIYEFNVVSRNWTRCIDCPHVYYGFAAIGNELVAVGGLVKIEDCEVYKFPSTNKVLCFSLEINSKAKQKTRKSTRQGMRKSKTTEEKAPTAWKNKYPPMKKERVNPNVLVSGKYLTVIGGFMHTPNESGRNVIREPIMSVEILDVEGKTWHFNDKINLPEEFSTMTWLSACINDKDLYITAEHDDPDFKDTLSALIYERIKDDWDYQPGDEDIQLSDSVVDTYPCFSLYRCSVESLLQFAQEESKMEMKILWQKLQHPHDSVYLNLIPNRVSEEGIEEADYLGYCACCFTISSVNNELVAVGCQHIQSVSNEYLRQILSNAYDAYQMYQEYSGPYRKLIVRNDEETIDSECHIYRYDAEADCWEFVKSTPPNGESSSQPSVAVVNDNKLVIVRNSQTVFIVPYP